MANKSKYLIVEFSEFVGLRRDNAGSLGTAPVNDMSLSTNGYGRFVNNKLLANNYLATILRNVLKDTPMSAIESEEEVLQGLSDLQIEKILEKNGDINVFFSIKLDGEEYFGCIEKYTTESNFTFELFYKEPIFNYNTKLRVKITGIIKKSIQNFFKVKHGKFVYIGEEDLKITNEELGQHAFLKKGDGIVVTVSDKGYIQFRMHNSIKYTPFKLTGIPTYTFHYYFKEINKENQ